jgi:hypothetical protein
MTKRTPMVNIIFYQMNKPKENAEIKRKERRKRHWREMPIIE